MNGTMIDLFVKIYLVAEYLYYLCEGLYIYMCLDDVTVELIMFTFHSQEVLIRKTQQRLIS